MGELKAGTAVLDITSDELTRMGDIGDLTARGDKLA